MLAGGGATEAPRARQRLADKATGRPGPASRQRCGARRRARQAASPASSGHMDVCAPAAERWLNERTRTLACLSVKRHPSWHSGAAATQHPAAAPSSSTQQQAAAATRGPHQRHHRQDGVAVPRMAAAVGRLPAPPAPRQVKQHQAHLGHEGEAQQRRPAGPTQQHCEDADLRVDAEAAAGWAGRWPKAVGWSGARST